MSQSHSLDSPFVPDSGDHCNHCGKLIETWDDLYANDCPGVIKGYTCKFCKELIKADNHNACFMRELMGEPGEPHFPQATDDAIRRSE
jgi:hypothetical protein